MQGFAYTDDGDWVESSTAPVERHDGKLEILRRADENHETGQAPSPPRSMAAA